MKKEYPKMIYKDKHGCVKEPSNYCIVQDVEAHKKQDAEWGGDKPRLEKKPVKAENKKEEIKPVAEIDEKPKPRRGRPKKKEA